MPLLTFLPLVAQALVLLVAGRMVISGSLSLGAFFAFNLLLAMLVMPLRMLGMWIGQAQRAIAAGERIFEVLDEPEEVADAPDAQPLPARPGRGRLRGRLVRIRPASASSSTTSTSASRPAERSRSSDARARARRPSRRSCRGSTTRRTAASSSTASTSGELVRRSLRREIGVISQDPFLFSASIRDNIALGMPDAPHDAVEAAARAAQAHEFILELPHGYETVVGERGITLSGGQRQRIAIARALLIDPRILILDDATASVDATTEAKIRAGLREVMRDRTTIIIAHRLSTIALADEVVVLDEGRIAARGTQAELLETSPVFREIHEHGLLQQVVAG